MEKSNQSEKNATNAEVTNNLIDKTVAIKKKIREVNQKLNELKQASDKLLHPQEKKTK